MDTLSILLNSLWPNLKIISLVLSIFFLTSVTGLIFFKALFRNESLFLSIPAGVVLGVFGLILYLGVLSHIFKGPSGILMILILYVGTGLLIYFKHRNLIFSFYFLTNIKKLFNLRNCFALVISLFFLSLFFITVGNNTYGGDVIAYWGFATSFANGNYPIYSLWQPGLLAAHHQGAYLYEGALYALSGSSISLVHTLFSFVIVSSGFFLLWALVAKLSGYKLLSVFVAMVFYISFAATFIILPKETVTFLNPEVNHTVDKLPIMTDAKNRLGGSSNLNELIYINHRAAAFAGLILVLTILTLPTVAQKWKITAVSLVAIPIISSDEVVLPSIGLIGLGWFFYQIIYLPAERKLLIKYAVMGALICLLLFFIIGSALRDALLIPASVPRFHLITNVTEIIGRLGYYRSAVLTLENLSLILFLPNLIWLMIVTVAIGLYKKNLFVWLILLGCLGSIVGVLLTEHTFYPGNYGRFFHLTYLLNGVGLSFGLLILLNSRVKWLRWISVIVFIILFSPGLLSSSLYQLNQAKGNEYRNYNSRKPDYPVLNWIQMNISDKKVFFIDGYLKGKSYSYLVLNGIQQFGLFVPVSPAFIKVHTPDFGIEAIDTIVSLDPESIKDLDIEYIYILNDLVKTYSDKRQQDLMNDNYFKLVYTNKEGKLYKIGNDFKELADIQGDRLRDLKKLIEKETNIYLDSPPEMPMTLRSPMILALQDIGSLYTFKSSGDFNYIEMKLEYQDPKPDIKYDYLFLDSKSDPLVICNCQNVIKIWDIGEVKGYKVNE